MRRLVCADVQAGLRLCCLQTPEDRFSRVEAHIESGTGINKWEILTLCMLDNFSSFSFCLMLFFSKFNLKFSKNSFRNTVRVSNGLDPDQDRHLVGPDLGSEF